MVKEKKIMSKFQAVVILPTITAERIQIEIKKNQKITLFPISKLGLDKIKLYFVTLNPYDML